MKYALIGCGRISMNHLVAATNNNLEIVAVCDIDIEKAHIVVKQLNLSAGIYSDYHVMLQKENVALVAIATESGKHAAIALDCINSGCNVIIEKPITLSLEDADKIIQLAEIKGIKVCVCHQNRFNKSIQKVREAVLEGRFGKLFYGTAHIRWHRGAAYYASASWRGSWECDGGALMNQCIHNIDLLRWLLGEEIIEVTGYIDRLNHDYIQAEDMGMAIIKFKNGSYGIIEGTTNVFPCNLEETLYLFGEKGTVKAGGDSVNRIDEWIFADCLEDCVQVKNEYSEEIANVYGFGHTPLYKDMVEAIRDGRQPAVDAYAGRNALELVLAIYKSALIGKSISLPLESCCTLEFSEIFKQKDN